MMDLFANKIISKWKKCRYDFNNMLLNGVASSIFTPPFLRNLIYKCHGYKIGRGSVIYHQCFCGVGNGSKGKLTMGDDSYINYRCFLDLGDDIILGNHVSVAFGCTFINSSHELGGSVQRAGRGTTSKIVIEDGCWIGANVTIMPGVCIKAGCVIGSGSLVLSSTEPNGVYVGRPATRIKTLV